MSRQTPVDEIKPLHEEQLLLSRDQTRAILGVSYHQVVLLEEAGQLRAVRLVPGPRAKAYYRRCDVIALTQRYSEPFTSELKQRERKKQNRSA